MGIRLRLLGLVITCGLCWSATTVAQWVLPLPGGVEGHVRTVVAQPDGKVLIGGGFTAVNNVPRQNIARLMPDGSLDTTWNPGVDGDVYAFIFAGETIYAAGCFNTIGGQSRASLAALDTTTGEVKSWDPNAGGGAPGGCAGTIRAVALSTDAGTIYVGGDFVRIGGIVRKGLAAIDTASGAIRSWDPQADDSNLPGFPSFYAIAVSNVENPPSEVVYVGGYFTKIKGSLVDPYLAVLDSSSGQIRPNWHAQADGPVTTITVVNTTVYAGGLFGMIGGQPRNHLAALRAYPDPVSSLAYSWNPSPDGSISDIAISGDTMFVGGNFSHIGGQPRERMAQLPVSPLGDQATDWSPRADGYVLTIGVSSGAVVIGGTFTHVNGTQRYGLARVTASERIFSDGFDGAAP